MWSGVLACCMGVVFLVWFLVIRPGDKAHHERRLALMQKRIQASQERSRVPTETESRVPAETKDGVGEHKRDEGRGPIRGGRD